MCTSNPTKRCAPHALKDLKSAEAKLEASLSKTYIDFEESKRLSDLVKIAQQDYDETYGGTRELHRLLREISLESEKLEIEARISRVLTKRKIDFTELVAKEGKRCQKCKIHKPAEDFYKNISSNDSLQKKCKSCHKSESNAAYQNTEKSLTPQILRLNRRKKLVTDITESLLKKGCFDCGKCVPGSMDFDHINGTKIGDISGFHKIKGNDTKMVHLLKEELKKCVVRCGNCHRIVTFDRQKNNKRKIFLKDPQSPKLSEKEKYVYSVLKNSQCHDCNEKDMRVLEFDHVEGIKIRNVSIMMAKHLWEIKDIEDEISKCEIRCVNCHRKETQTRIKEKTKKTSIYRPTETETTCSCGKKKTFGAVLCIICTNKSRKIIQGSERTVFEYPATDEIIAKLRTGTWTSVSKEIGVSDNGLRKHLKNLGFDTKAIKTKFSKD